MDELHHRSPPPPLSDGSPAHEVAAAPVRRHMHALARRVRIARVLFGRRWRAFLRGDDFAPLLLSVVIGVVVGLAVVAVKIVVQWMHEVIFSLPPGGHLSAQLVLNPYVSVLAPTLGGLLVGLLTYLIRRTRKREAVDPIEANALYGGRMSLTDSLLLTLGTMISSGAGASVGLEAGYTQSGSGFGSYVARALRLRRADTRTLVACGASAAIAAAFDAPLAGAFYAFELTLGVYGVATLAPVVLAALIASAIDQSLLHGLSLTVMGTLTFAGYDYLVFIVMGLVAGGLGILLMRTATSIEALLRWTKLPRMLRPALGGLAVGGLALYSPAVLGAGHGGAHVYFFHAHDLTALGILVLAKMLAASISIGSGFRGGLFYTSLFVGVLFGGWSAEVYEHLAPALASDRLVYVLVGMASFAAAVIGAPFTMTFLVLETTRDMALTSGVLVAVVSATMLVRRTFGYTFSTWRFHLRGETIRSALDVGWARDLTVVKLMRREARTVHEVISVAAFRKRFPIGSTERVFLIDEAGRYAGLVLVSDIHAPERDAEAETTPVREFRLAPASFLLPRQTVNKVLETFERAEVETLVVVDDPASLHVLGYVTEAHALKRYSQELERRRQEYAGER